MALSREEILSRIGKLQLLMLQTPDTYVNEYEIVIVEKIKDQFERGWPAGGRHASSKYMVWLNQMYKDYRHRKTLDITESREVLKYRKIDMLFSENDYDKMMYKLRFKYLYSNDTDDINDIGEVYKTIRNIKKSLKNDLSVSFAKEDITRIRISKKPGDLVMVENPFDNNHSFPAVIDEIKIDHIPFEVKTPSGIYRAEVTWHKQDDNDVRGKSTITEIDIEANNILFAEETTNL
ncbi:hypothetical protein CL614_03550 [archaeon]|nr:hypothetical protein [archaeon]